MAGAGSNVAGVAAMHGIEVGLFPSVCVSGDSNRHSGYYVGPFQDGYQGHDCVGTLPGGSVQRLGEGLRSHPIQSRRDSISWVQISQNTANRESALTPPRCE